MVTLTFQCTSLSQLREEMAAFLNGSLPPVMNNIMPIDTTLPPASVTQIRTEVAAKLEAEATPVPSEKKPARKGRKAKPAEQTVYESPTRDPEESFEVKKHHQEPAESEVEEPTTAATSEAQVLTAPVVNKEAVHQALQQVNVAVGLPKAREILQSFGVNRISEIKEDQFKPFIEKCNEAVMLEG